MDGTTVTEPPPRAEWLAHPERGTTFAIRVLVGLTRVFGRRFARGIVAIIAFYYALWAKAPAAASRHWWKRVDGRSAGFGDVYRHILRFCQCALDRMFFLQGRVELFEIERTGPEHLVGLAQARQGAILLGAHLGSFEAMRAMSKAESLAVNVLVHFENAKKINAVLAAVAPEAMNDVIAIHPGDPSFVFTVQRRIENGELVAILGDRVGLGERTVEVLFMGEPARFPLGPFMLAATLGCPIYLVFGLHEPPNRYRLFCEPFVERLELPRKDRESALTSVVTRYAQRLEHYARMAPDNWFNFFDFWGRDEQA